MNLDQALYLLGVLADTVQHQGARIAQLEDDNAGLRRQAAEAATSVRHPSPEPSSNPRHGLGGQTDAAP